VSQNGNSDQVQPLREESLGLPLERRDVELPVHDDAAIPAIPAETVEGRALPEGYEPAHRLLPAERVEAPLGTTLREGREDEKPRFYKSTRPDAPLRPREDGEEPKTRRRLLDREPLRPTLSDREPTEPRLRDREPLQPTLLDRDPAKPRFLERDAAKEPTGDGKGDGDNPPPPTDNPPTGGQQPPSENPPTTESRSNAHGSVSVDTEKLAQAIPGLDRIMRQMFSIGNNTANALAGYRLDRGDSYGEAWTKTADPISEQILQGLSDAGTVFGDTAEGAHLMVHNYNVTEENAIESAGDLLPREK
jgi:hypothetical protein